MNYNLIRNAYFRSLTVSGTGNVDLSWTQLESLMDQNLTSSGVTLTISDILYLETDLSQRIKVDGIRLYASDLSKSSNINFYYKNAESDSYTLLTTYSGASYYYTTITSPSAPQFMRVTVSGVATELYEFLIYNDDYVVAFGTDGQTYAKYLDNTPVGEEGAPQAIAIYNNDTSAIPATGYTTIDYTGTDADNYVKISPSENGTYKGLADGVLIKDNSGASTYIWDMGEYTDNTIVENNKLILVDTDTTDAKDKLCDLPLTDGSESLNVGESAMTYDLTNEVIYALGCEASPTILKLYKYDIPTNDWIYLWEVNPGITGYENNAGICYLDGYVYIVCNTVDFVFGKYNMVTMSGVWEPLATASGLPSQAGGALSIDTDGNTYIYLAVADRVSGNAFQRYNTVSGTWAVLDNGFGRSSSGFTNITMSMAYDTDRDYVYAFAGDHGGTYEYVSRYSVATDTWNANYLNRTTLGGSPFGSCVAYYEDYIFLYGSGYTPTAYLYHIPSDSSRSVSVGNPTIHPVVRINNSDFKTFMQVISPRKGNDTMSIIFGCVAGYEDELYGYNMTPVYDRSGTYTSPIFKMDDVYSSSYFIVDATTTSGFTSASYDDGSYNGTIRVRSSNIDPLTVDEIYWTYPEYTAHLVPYNDSQTDQWILHDELNAYHTAVNRRNGDVAVACGHHVWFCYVKKYDKNGNLLYSQGLRDGTYAYTSLEFDKFGGIWLYSAGSYYLCHLNYSLGTVTYSLIGVIDFLHDLAVEMDGDGVWYTDKIYDFVIHRDANGVLLRQIALNEPRAICGTLDNGCWVIDNGGDIEMAYRYNSGGDLVKTVSLGRPATYMTTDMSDGFWYISDSRICHVTSGGIETVNIGLDQPTRIKGGYNGCIVWSSSQDYVKYIDNAGNITRTFSISGESNTACPALLSFKYDSFKTFKDTINILPASYDPVWGTGGSLEWKEVRKDGYFLPKGKYHQAELTLRTNNVAYTPYVSKLVMAPAIKIEDIPSKSYKNMYIKTDIPPGADITDHETKLKTWWKIEA
jgi:hypothetical protein